MTKRLIVPGHRIEWFVYAGRERLRHTANMRGAWGYDAVCECGWETRTGGAVLSYVKTEVWIHKLINRPELDAAPTAEADAR
jgi:mannose/cellobiose epimerase-like protein (N-acyl-D-glucosamine 2-epimerase family)